MSPINLTDVDDPHHSLLYKPKKATEKDERLLENYEKNKIIEDEVEAETNASKEKVFWWGKAKE